MSGTRVQQEVAQVEQSDVSASLPWRWSSPREPDTPTMGDESPRGSDWEKSRRNDVSDASSRMSSNVTRSRSCGRRVSRSRRWPVSWGSTGHTARKRPKPGETAEDRSDRAFLVRAELDCPGLVTPV